MDEWINGLLDKWVDGGTNGEWFAVDNSRFMESEIGFTNIPTY